MKGQRSQQAIELVKQRISSIKGNFNGRAVLLFSGGRDSSTVAAAFCNAFPQGQLHLLLVDNGLLSRLDSTKRQAALLQSLFPKNDVIFETKRVSQMMRQVGMQQVEKDFTIHHYSTLLICVACKLIMNFSAARYAKELGIRVILDGFADRQKDFPEQTNVFMDFIRRFFEENSLIYLSPLYDFLVEKPIIIQALDEMGVYIAKQEPVCMWADSFSKANEEEIASYMEKTVSLIEQYDPVLRC